jgi:site-specific DNA-methyltransferase (adenine-specific)
MEIKIKKINEIIPYEGNPRSNDAAIDAVAQSIKEFGWRNPIIVDKDHVIIAGHSRLKAAQQLGLDEVPVHVADDLTASQVKALRIADNKTAELAEWNYELLPIELKDLDDANFDLSLLGFDSNELEGLLKGNELVAGETDPDDVREVPEKSNSIRGEVYQLGEHALMCGDGTCTADIQRLMNGETADLWVTDPPYNVAYEGSTGMTIQNDAMEDGQFRAFLLAAFSNVKGVLRPGGAFYVFHADVEGHNFRWALIEAGFRIRECLIWVKNAFALSHNDYHYKHEPILYGWNDGAAHEWLGDRSQTTILEYDRPQKNNLHPTMKPVAMLAYLLGNSSKRNGIVLDTFGGSGSTLIAAEQMGRKCRMLELDEKYCDVIRRRWAEFKHGEGCNWQTLTPVIADERKR